MLKIGDSDQALTFLESMFGMDQVAGSVYAEGADSSILTQDYSIIGEMVGDPTASISLVTQKDGADWEVVGLATTYADDEHPERVLQPTILLQNEDVQFAIWLLVEPIRLEGSGHCDRLEAINVLLNGDTASLSDIIPLPGAVGWETSLVGGRHTLDALEQAFTPPAAADDTERFQDARIHGHLDAALLQRQIQIGLTKRGAEAKKWHNSDTTLGQLVSKLATHAAGEKDGPALLQGAVIEGERKAQSISHLDLLILDLDTGENIDRVIDRLKHLNLFAVVYSTHSHLKPVSEVPKDRFLKWSDGTEPTAASAARYFQEEKRYQPEILAGAELLPTEHTKDGIMIRLRHQPMPKFRVLLVLKDRFVMADRKGATHKDAITEWKERYAGVASLLGATFDRSCVDPSRLMFLPRHPEGAEFRIDILAGGALDLDTVERINLRDIAKGDVSPWDQAANAMGGGREAKVYLTGGLLRFIAKSGDRFEMVDFLQEHMPDGDRGDRGGKPGKHWLCPNDDAHTNAGDSEDRAFFCVNASESDNGAVAKCMHDSCSSLDRVDFIDLVCAEAGIEHAIELKKFLVEMAGDEPDEDDEAVETPQAGKPVQERGEAEPEPGDKKAERVRGVKSVKEAKGLIADVRHNDATAADEIAKKIGRSKLSPTEKSSLINDLSKASGFGKQSLKTSMRQGEPQNDAEGTYDSDDVITHCNKFNGKFAVVQMKGKVKVLQEPEEIGDFPELLDAEAFHTLEKPKRIAVLDGSGNRKIEAVSKLWLEWEDRRTYRRGIVFEPEKECKGAYNIWRGFPVKPVMGEWDLMNGHIFDTICQGNDEYYQWLMTWIAQMFQYPGRKMGSCVALMGLKGTGKSKLFDWVRKGMGQHAIKVAQTDHIIGKFNSHQKGAVLMVCEEAFWAGNVAAGGVLKDMITSDQMMVENKGLDLYQVSNYMRLAMISNEKWIVPAGLEDERRFFVLEVGNQKRGDTNFFAAIDAQMERGGLEAMIYDMMHWVPPNGDWNILRTPPRTRWLVAQGLEGLEPWDRFFHRVIADEGTSDIPHTEINGFNLNHTDVSYVPIKLLRSHYDNFLKNYGGNGRWKQGNDRYMKELAQKWLLCESKSVTHRYESELQKCYIIPPVAQILAHHKANDINFEE